MSGVLDVLASVFKLGLPLAGLSWFLFARLYLSGDIHRDADRKTIKTRVKSLRSTFKKQRKRQGDFVYDKWMWFGSGFYGLAALWTFVIIELSDLIGFVFNNPGWAALFADGLLSLAIEVLSNQLANVLSAFLWFGWWETDSVLFLVLIAWLGYWVGVEAARRGLQIPVALWLQKLREFVKSRTPQ